ncbi:hypothetical protein QTG56_24775 (plasmid) [Rossellomorea sp. AcN35-11]|nr:hypothetical protein [Rossellomorea aquimaris]WJV31850.1 hypothetical protein QTG56_24775 [Rossellomorea sp. AcN35-11]
MSEITEEHYYSHVNGYWKHEYETGGFFSKTPFKKTYKKKWSFHCINCEEKVTVPTNPEGHYYVWNVCRGYPFNREPKNSALLCSKKCADEGYKRLTLEMIQNGRLKE